MRAIDYRAPNLGIMLIIAKPFDHYRQAQQGLGRVGRNNDPCKRLILNEVKLVNEEARINYNAHLMEYFTNFAAKKFNVDKKKAAKKNVSKAEVDYMKKFITSK